MKFQVIFALLFILIQFSFSIKHKHYLIQKLKQDTKIIPVNKSPSIQQIPFNNKGEQYKETFTQLSDVPTDLTNSQMQQHMSDSNYVIDDKISEIDQQQMNQYKDLPINDETNLPPLNEPVLMRQKAMYIESKFNQDLARR